MRFGNLFKNPLGLAVKIIIKIYPFIICPISSCHGSRKVKRLFDFTTVLPACELACQYSLSLLLATAEGTLPLSAFNKARTERRSLTSRYHGGKVSGSQQSALTETAGRKVWVTVLFLSAILHRKLFSFFFSAIIAGLRLLRSTNFATMATWRNDFSLFECTITTTPPPPPPHTHPTCSCLFTSLCKPWYQSAYSPNCSLCICCCTKVKRSAYSSRYLDLLRVDLTSFLASGGSLLGEEKSSRKFSRYFSNRQSLFSITVVFLFIPAMFLRK